jgi:hypothetical protein
MEVDAGAMAEMIRERLTFVQQQEGTLDEGPLVNVVRQGHVQTIESEIKMWQEMRPHVRDGFVPLHALKAAVQGRLQALCERHLDFECNDVIVAADQVEEFAPVLVERRNQFLVMRSAFEKTLSASHTSLAKLAFRDEGGDSYLHKAVCQGDNDRILHLLRVGADVNAMNSDSMTPLTYAVFKGNLEAMKLLVDFGADTSIQGFAGTVLHVACVAPDLSTKVVDRLLRAGADEGALNERGLTPLDMLTGMRSGKEGFGSVRSLLEKAPVRRRWLRRWGSIAMIRNRDTAEGGRGRVIAQEGKRRSTRLFEGRSDAALKFLVYDAPDGLFYRVTSFLDSEDEGRPDF